MGNQSTKPVSEEETVSVPKEVLPRSLSSSSVSSESEEAVSTDKVEGESQTPSCPLSPATVVQDEDNDEETKCSLSAGAGKCIPPVLSFYRKEDPLLVRPSDNKPHNSDCEHDDNNSVGSQQGSPTSRKSRGESCSTTRRRRRSWSPTSNKKVGFFSKYRYSPNSASTSSISSLISKTRQQLLTSGYNEEERAMPDGHLPTPESDLNRLRDYYILTTASLPWFTGTAVNPLLRAASLSRYQRQQFAPNHSTVTLVLPWLEIEEDRVQLYGDHWKDKTQADQEAYIREWLSQANLPEEALPPSQGGIRILFYPARYHSKLSSIFAMGDLMRIFFSQNNDLTIPEDAVCVLEEPEHLHFYRNTNIRDHFCHIVGIIHTNYKAYASSAIPGGSLITGPLIASISSWLVRAYCDKVIKLSPVLQSFDCPEKEIVSNVHGIRDDFIREGERRAQQGESANGDKIYFVGKLLWQKGLDKLLELEALYRTMTGDYFPIDIYGSGPDKEDIENAFSNEKTGFLRSRSFGSNSALEEIVSEENEPPTTPEATPPSTNTNVNTRRALEYVSTLIGPRPPIPAKFMGREDHAKLTSDYKIFVNPSITEVLCTTTAEATAMGKFVIVPDHPSNQFFHQFPNCLLYKNKAQFVDFLQYAITHDPEPLRGDLIRLLTWEAATERFIKASAISRRDAKWRERTGKDKYDEKLAKLHYELGKGAKGDVLRKVLGGGPVADQNHYERQRTLSEGSHHEDQPESNDVDNAVSEVAATDASE